MCAFAHASLQARPSVTTGSGFDVGVDLLFGLGGSAVAAFLTTLVVGGILVALVPHYVERTTASVAGNPIDSLLYGVVTLLILLVAVLVLFVTVIGVAVAVPLLVVTTILWSVGATIAYLAIADRLTGRGGGWSKPLLTAAIINGGLTLTGVGGLISLTVGAAGFGAVLRGRLD